MTRLRANRSMPGNKGALVDSAVYACKPPPAQLAREQQATPLQRYMRFLLEDCLLRAKAGKGKENAGNAVDVVLHLRRLPWADCEGDFVEAALEVCFTCLKMMMSKPMLKSVLRCTACIDRSVSPCRLLDTWHAC